MSATLKLREEHDSKIHFRVSYEKIMQWRRFCDERHVAISELLRKAADEYIERESKTDRARQTKFKFAK